MPRKQRTGVTGIGGFFFKSRDPKVLAAWYARMLGVPIAAWGGWAFEWRELAAPTRRGRTIWSPFRADSDYFEPSKKDFMFNFRVADLDATLVALRRRGVKVDPVIQDSEFGRFGWCMDPEGNRIELWQPPPPTRTTRSRRRRAPAKKVSAKPKRRATRAAPKRKTARRKQAKAEPR